MSAGNSMRFSFLFRRPEKGSIGSTRAGRMSIGSRPSPTDTKMASGVHRSQVLSSHMFTNTNEKTMCGSEQQQSLEHNRQYLFCDIIVSNVERREARGMCEDAKEIMMAPRADLKDASCPLSEPSGMADRLLYHP